MKKKTKSEKSQFYIKMDLNETFCLVSSVLASIVIFIEQEEWNIEKKLKGNETLKTTYFQVDLPFQQQN